MATLSHSDALRRLPDEPHRATRRAYPNGLWTPSNESVCRKTALDLGFHWRATRMFLLTPRSVSMGTHYLEELDQGNTWRHIPAGQIEYQE